LSSSRSGRGKKKLYLPASKIRSQARQGALYAYPKEKSIHRFMDQIRQRTKLRRSLTWDRGLEMAKHKTFTVATNVKVYFCDPHSPRRRGTNENTNRLLRQYFPKRIDLSSYAQSDLDKVALRLNQRPRKTLGFETPASRLPAVSRRPVEPARIIK